MQTIGKILRIIFEKRQKSLKPSPNGSFPPFIIYHNFFSKLGLIYFLIILCIRQRLFTACQNSILDLSISQFEVHDFGRISYKKLDKIYILRYLRQTYQHLTFLSKLAEICTRWACNIGEQSWELFWKFWKLATLCQFSQKMAWKWLLLGHFSWKIGTKPPIFKKALNFVPPYSRNIWCKFQLI